ERRVERFLEVFRDTILLHSQPDVLFLNLEVGLDNPVLAVGAERFEEEGMRPAAGAPAGVQAAFRAQNELVGQARALAKADAAGLGVASEELAVRQIFHQHRLRLTLDPMGVVSGLSAHLRACCSIMATTSSTVAGLARQG